MRRLFFAVLLLALVPAVGVDSATPGGALRSFVRGSWHDLLKAHHGQAVVVHFWGLTCGPCLAELPDWATAAKQRPDLDLVLVDASPYSDDAGAVREVLAQDGLTRQENWIFADSFEERLRYEVDPHWQGEMPYTLLIGRDGKVTRVVGRMNFADLNTWLDKQKTGS